MTWKIKGHLVHALKTENGCFKTFVKIRVDEKVCENV